MPTGSASPNHAATTAAASAGELRYVARQAIMDAQGRVHGYELLFRDGADAAFRGDGAMSTRTISDDTDLFGVDRYTNGLPAFIKCSAEMLIERLVSALPSAKTVLLIPATVQPTTELVEACLELRASGFRLALDHYAWDTKFRPLLESADYICIDFSSLGSEARQKLRQQLSQLSVSRIAKRVRTQADYEQASAAGFNFFQGDYLCQPVLRKDRKVPTNRFLNFELLRHLNHDPVDLRKVSELVQRDPSLTYRLLRLVNSPFCAVRQEVRSIDSALLIIGEATFRRVATLAILSELNTGQPPEILHMALLRARFCALAAAFCPLDPAEQYLLGLLSLLPAMLGLPMEALTPSLPLRSEIREALEGRANAERSLLAWLEFHEHGDWTASDSMAQANNLAPEQPMRCYGEAVDWARATVVSAG